MEEKDRRPYFVLTNEYTRHRKVRGLSDKAFRLHVTLLGTCNEDKNNGIIGQHDLDQKGKAAGLELIANNLVEKRSDGQYVLHDYLEHQKSREEIEALKSKKSAAGAIGAHTRHHERKGIFDISCEHCQASRTG